MANSYTQIHIHAVFAVQDRISLINKNWRERLHKYIIVVIQKHEHKVLSIGGTEDHVHILFGFRPMQSLSSLMQEVKRDTSEWINQNKFSCGKKVMERFHTANHKFRTWQIILKIKKSIMQKRVFWKNTGKF